MTAHDPQLDILLGVFPSFGIEEDDLGELRVKIAALVPPFELPSNVVREEHFAPGSPSAPAVRLLVWRPATSCNRAAVLHIHGGGTIFGAPEMNEARNAALALELGCAVISVDYRLAPETAAPGNAEDCYAALAWMHARPAELAIDPDRIAVLGESAGGLLAASLALMARDRANYGIAFLALIYPMLDDRTTLDEGANATGEHIWTRDANRFAWNCLLGGRCGEVDLPDKAVPARAVSLAGMPPTFMAVGALDLFVEEDLAFAARLARAGVPLELHVYPGAFHAFDMAEYADVSQRFKRDLLAGLKSALAV